MASTALATPSMARDGAWYVGIDGGVSLFEDLDIAATPAAAGAGYTADADHEYGYDFGGRVGYDFGAFRLEAEASYRGADPDTIRVAGVTYDGTVVGTEPAGDTESLSFMLNGLLDFGPDDGLQGYVGGGVGIARTSVDVATVLTGQLVDDSDSGFAWQILAGVRAPLTDSIDVGLRYRFFNHDNVDLVATNGDALATELRTHSLMGSFIFNFGGAEAPPPPPAVCNTGPYIVFFEWDQSDLTADAQGVLNQAVSAYRNCGTATVMLAGHTDTSGTQAYNMGLAERRNDSVRAYLSANGIPGGRITSEAFGETQLRVPTADGVRELQNRRVEIKYAP